MKRILTTYPVISTLALICLSLGLLTSFYGDAMYDLLAFHSKPAYAWQYVSGTLMHGSKGAPIWFLWVHLLLNGLMILPFGGLLERKMRLRTSLNRFCDGDSPLFHRFSLFNPGAGHSGNRDLCCRIRLCDRRDYAPAKCVERVLTHRKMVLSIFNFLSGLMLLPVITGWISTLLHLSGIVSYLLVFIGSKGLKRRS